MKTFKALLAIAAVAGVAIGCSTTKDRENMLSAAGFKAIPADTPERQTHLKSLPNDKLTTVQRNGTLYYVFPDQKQNVLYVGQEQQYQQYQQLRYQKQLADEQLSAASMNENAWGAWGAWPVRGWVWR
jgi:hypothetical protein